MEVKLYVGNLSYATREEELRELFAQAGTVT
jgi:RNA recognition motif-containing protein